MHAIKQIAVTLFLLVVGAVVGCAEITVAHMAVAKGASPSGPLPPNTPRPIDTFDVRFVPSTNQVFPPTNTSQVLRYKNILHWPDAEDIINGSGEPNRPYIVIGKLHLSENWYFDQNINDLVSRFVPQYGGDAVLTYEAFQTKAALVTNPDTKAKMNVYYQRVEMDIIRFVGN